MEPTRVRLTRALERQGLGPWRNEKHKSAMTKGQFLEVVTELLEDDIHGQLEQLDLERQEQRREEGAAWALIGALRAGILTEEGIELVRSWVRDFQKTGLSSRFTVGRIRLIPPEKPELYEEGE